MRNTGILFMECLENTVFIPVIEIEVDCFTKNWGGVEKTNSIHIGTNALVENISPGIASAGEIKQTIREIVTQKKVVVDNNFGYQKLVFEEDFRHGEQNETGESAEKPITEYQERELEKLIKKYTGDEEQRESKKSSEQPRTGCQASDEMLEEIHSLLQKLSDMHNPMERNYSHDEKVLGIVMNVFSEDRS
ncbi:MAG: uncharacterized protein A8A55_3467 [Amphiamblys sp. WSBS2006]|nr:MAG: uncharacterized protein A8A55_3467 [Amphiamblys sp. WSBS2006]